VKSGEFFRAAKRSGLWPEAEAVHHSAVCRARRKVHWHLLQDMLNDAVTLAYECWPQDSRFGWHGKSVCAVDGSKYDLPATADIREEFDPNSGLQYPGKGHYPQCLVSTAYDVFRRLPIARTVVPVNSSERDEVKPLLKFIPSGSVLLFDRGYPSYELIRYLDRRFRGYFIFRCPSQSTFPAVQAFVESGKEEDETCIEPSSNYRNKIPKEQRKDLKAIKIRVIKLVSPDGTVSVLLTNLYDKKEFSAQELTSLYFKRWEVESYYRDEKVVLEIEEFHGKSCNSVRQELFAAMIMSVISRALMVLSQMLAGDPREPQFKNAIMTLASEAAVFAADDPVRAISVFQDILEEIRRVVYYRPQKPRPSPPRVTKRSKNKWIEAKIEKVANA
jgi:Transposase DDE domain